MVDEYRNIMAFMAIFAHLHILRRKRRGIQPKVIEFIFDQDFRLEFVSAQNFLEQAIDK